MSIIVIDTRKEKMKIKPIKGYCYFWLITFLVFSLVGFLGFRTIQHQVLLNRYQVEEQAKQQLSKVDQFIWHLLNQKATRLDAVANFLQLTDESIKKFISTDNDVKHLFILKKNQLIFPKQNHIPLQTEQFIKSITPIIDDPNLLFAPYIKDEHSKPNSGWYINYNHQIPLLIYWFRRDNTIIGFDVSYVSLLADVINTAQFEDSTGTLKIFENSRLLYQSNDHRSPLLASKYLNYPLSNWQINYYGQSASSLAIYLWGSTIVLFLLVFLSIIMLSLYREYTRTSRQALQQVNFVSQVSHELKTPLTNITLYAELLHEEIEQENAEHRIYTDIIIQESQRLSRLIQNILSFTKSPKVHITSFNLTEAIQELAITFKPSFANKGIDLVVATPQDTVITSDKDSIVQILCNFLSNAEKYAAQGKRVDLNMRVDKVFIEISVRDYGEGIASKDQAQIFKPFYRIKSSITEGVAGTGIGLTIAKQLATTLEADILVTSMHPGVCFTLRLRRELMEG